jgi:cation diffusion facilitator family transporter
MAGGEGHAHGTKAIVAAFFANLGIAISKFIGWAITGSAAMLAEAIHSVADTGNQLLLLLGGRRARKEATPLHPFGFGRERYFWSFVVALVLFTLGSAFAIREGIHKIQDPHPLESVGVAYAILGVSILLESFSLRTAIVESRKVKGSNSWPQFVRRAKTPELPVVLLEDLGALAGLVIAFVAIAVSEATGEPKWDGVGTLTIGLLLGVIAITLAIEMKSLLIGEAADPEVQGRIQRAIESDDDVLRLIHFRTEHIGPDEILVAGKVEFAPALSGRELAAVVDRVEGAIRAEVPMADPIYLEPDVLRDAAPDAQTPAPGGGAGVTP